ncbi:MAG: hypothetical protein QW303_00070 [Nitrososphaerota archaeon]
MSEACSLSFFIFVYMHVYKIKNDFFYPHVLTAMEDLTVARVAPTFSLDYYLIIDIWSLVFPLLSAPDILNFSLCSRELYEFVKRLKFFTPLFININADVRLFSKMLRKREISDIAYQQCVIAFVKKCKQKQLYGYDPCRFVKLCIPQKRCINLNLLHLVKRKTWNKVFNIILNDSTGKYLRIINSPDVRPYFWITNSVGRILGNDTKFSQEFRSSEVCVRLKWLIHNIVVRMEVPVERIVLDSLNPGETLTAPRELVILWYSDLPNICTKLGITLCLSEEPLEML